ncbi:hypothetical protein TI04_06610 [Achromatium sp. WMS2]|nr:hypothetical protein TI04_06610 [Achromatium sp. WMS2]
MIGLLTMAGLLYLQIIGTASAVPSTNKDSCLRCHGMPTLAYQDQITGGIVSLYVDQATIEQSAHAKLQCLDCHHQDFSRYPHSEVATQQELNCTSCHQDNPRFDRSKFQKIEQEFFHSVHFLEMPQKFSCRTCHDPHTFQRGVKRSDVSVTIKNDNNICLHCHNLNKPLIRGNGSSLADLNTVHSWLPNLDLHWRKIRCVECHTPTSNHISHTILGADLAERDCVTCHAKNSLLLTGLYRHLVANDDQQNTAANDNNLNQIYVVGLTRNQVLDSLSIFLVILTISGIIIHGTERWLTRRKQRHDSDHG